MERGEGRGERGEGRGERGEGRGERGEERVESGEWREKVIPGMSIKWLGDLVDQALNDPLHRHDGNPLRRCRLLVSIIHQIITLDSQMRARAKENKEDGRGEEILLIREWITHYDGALL